MYALAYYVHDGYFLIRFNLTYTIFQNGLSYYCTYGQSLVILLQQIKSLPLPLPSQAAYWHDLT